MTYRKFKADYLFLGERMAEPDSVLIVTGDGMVQSIMPGSEAGEGVEVYEGLLCPGFVNCHCHLELSYMKGVIPERTGLVDFLSMVIRARGEERVQEAMVAAEQEMLDNGIVAVGDICNTTDTLEQKQLGRIAYRNFIETAGFIEKSAADRFAVSRAVFELFEETFPASNSIVPHAPYSVSPALFRLIADFPANRVLTMHSQETEAENEWMLAGSGDFLRLYAQLGVDVSFFLGTGKRSLASVLPYFRHHQSMILVHSVAINAEDLDPIWERPDNPKRYFCLCPNANLYISGQLPDVELLVNRGCMIVVGTDSLASNHGLSILAELKTLQAAFPWLETLTLLKWATLRGAAALQMDGVFGSLVPGRRPGVLLLQGLEGARLTAGTTVKRLV